MARWTLWAIWGYQRQAPFGHQGHTTTTRGSLHRSRRRGRTNVCTHSRGRAATDPSRGRHDVPCRPEDGHAVGQGREANVDPHARGAPALPGDRGPCTARGHPAAAFRVASRLESTAKEGGAAGRAVARAHGGARPAGFRGDSPSGRGQFARVILTGWVLTLAQAALAALGQVRAEKPADNFLGGPR